MKIQVTAEDIASGRRRNPNNCAISCALRRLGIANAGVGIAGRNEIWIYRVGMSLLRHGDVAVGWRAYGPAAAAVRDWDLGFDLEPFELELEETP
jgi:hypothetical protein